jgi:hypothetical protein
MKVGDAEFEAVPEHLVLKAALLAASGLLTPELMVVARPKSAVPSPYRYDALGFAATAAFAVAAAASIAANILAASSGGSASSSRGK